MPTNAESYFNQIINDVDPEAFLKGQANGVFEKEWLDFKQEPDNPMDTLKIWSKAVTGFSNTEGGVLVWGISADLDKSSKLDFSNGLAPIKNPVQLESLLRNNVANATTPPTQGIETRRYPETGAGFVVCFIPEGKTKPYRAEIGDKCYFIRSGSSFNDANPALLRAMSFPKSSPDLRVSVICQAPKDQATPNPHRPPPPLTAIFKIRIKNEGTASADGVTIQCRFDDSEGLKGVWNETGNAWQKLSGSKNTVGLYCRNELHPSQSSNATELGAAVPSKHQDNSNVLEAGGAVALQFVVYAKDMEARRFSVIFPPKHITDSRGKESAIISKGDSVFE